MLLNNLKLFILGFFVIYSFAFLSSSVSAASSFSEKSGLKKTGSAMGYKPDSSKTVEGELAKYIGVALSFIGVILLFLIIYAGYLWMNAQGVQADVDKSKKILYSAIIGFAIVASAYTITQFVYMKVVGGPSIDPAYQNGDQSDVGPPEPEFTCPPGQNVFTDYDGTKSCLACQGTVMDNGTCCEGTVYNDICCEGTLIDGVCN